MAIVEHHPDAELGTPLVEAPQAGIGTITTLDMSQQAKTKARQAKRPPFGFGIHKGAPMTAYRDRMLNGDYQPKADTARLDGKAKPKTAAKTQKGKRSGK